MGAIALAFLTPRVSLAQGGSASSFFRSIVGDWVGVCEQSCDGKPADNKYFHATIRQVDGSTFVGQFKYYRVDKRSGSPISIGDSTITSTMAPDGSVQNQITGKGSVLINETDSKDEQHQLTETLAAAGNGAFQGQCTGKIDVFGMPLGAGKNGKITNSKSFWSISNGVLTISQSLTAKFKALFISKSFSIVANSTARRGSDVFALMGSKTQCAKPSKSTSKRS